MRVAEILERKGSETATLNQTDSVGLAVENLRERGFGALVVSDNGATIDGIISERDIVREIGKRGAGVLDDAVDSMMTSKLVTCSPTDSALEVLEMMTTGRFRHMPVMEDGKMLGLISIGDAVKARLAELAMEKDALEGMIMGH